MVLKIKWATGASVQSFTFVWRRTTGILHHLIDLKLITYVADKVGCLYFFSGVSTSACGSGRHGSASLVAVAGRLLVCEVSLLKETRAFSESGSIRPSLLIAFIEAEVNQCQQSLQGKNNNSPQIQTTATETKGEVTVVPWRMFCCWNSCLNPQNHTRLQSHSSNRAQEEGNNPQKMECMVVKLWKRIRAARKEK